MCNILQTLFVCCLSSKSIKRAEIQHKQNKCNNSSAKTYDNNFPSLELNSNKLVHNSLKGNKNESKNANNTEKAIHDFSQDYDYKWDQQERTHKIKQPIRRLNKPSSQAPNQSKTLDYYSSKYVKQKNSVVLTKKYIEPSIDCHDVKWGAPKCARDKINRNELQLPTIKNKSNYNLSRRNKITEIDNCYNTGTQLTQTKESTTVVSACIPHQNLCVMPDNEKQTKLLNICLTAQEFTAKDKHIDTNILDVNSEYFDTYYKEVSTFKSNTKSKMSKWFSNNPNESAQNFSENSCTVTSKQSEIDSKKNHIELETEKEPIRMLDQPKIFHDRDSDNAYKLYFDSLFEDKIVFEFYTIIQLVGTEGESINISRGKVIAKLDDIISDFLQQLTDYSVIRFELHHNDQQITDSLTAVEQAFIIRRLKAFRMIYCNKVKLSNECESSFNSSCSSRLLPLILKNKVADSKNKNTLLSTSEYYNLCERSNYLITSDTANQDTMIENDLVCVPSALTIEDII